MTRSKAVCIVVGGRVQRIGFRAWTSVAAARAGVACSATNRDDGCVEVLAAGEVAAIESFVAACRCGPALARVDSVAVETVDVSTALEAIRAASARDRGAAAPVDRERRDP